MEVLFWLVFMIICIIIEIATLGLTSIWFAFGAVAAFIAALCKAPLTVQIVLFIVVSIVTLVFTRPWATRWFNKGTTKTNYEQAIGKKIRIIERVDNLAGTGAGIIDGLEWTARSLNDGDIFEAEEIAEVVEIKGVKAVVRKIKED